MNTKSFFYAGKVTDNQDPDRMNRVKVTSVFDGETVSDWMPVLSVFAGNCCGVFALPDVDDQVIVLSLDEKRNRQFVMGSFWNENADPPVCGFNSDADFNSNGRNELKMFRTKSGSMLAFDDTSGKEKIVLSLKDGSSRIEMNLEEETLCLETENDLVISAGGNLQLEAQKEIVLKSEKNIQFESDGLDISSGQDLNINSDRNIVLKGNEILLN